MSKLEDKLSATLKPARGKATPPAKPVLKPTTKPVPKSVSNAAAGSLSAQSATPGGGQDSTGRVLHPRRVWPD